MDLDRTRRMLTIATICLSFALAPRVFSRDMSMVQHGKQDGAVSGTWTSTLRIKGLKMRIDTVQDGETHIVIFDLERGKKFRLNPKRKEVSVADLKEASEHIRGRLLPEKLRRVIKATGKKSEIAGFSCDEYTFDLQAPTSPWHGMSAIQHDTGTVCVSQTIPEGVEFANFVHEAKKRGYTAAAVVLSPTTSGIGVYFFGNEPNVIVLAAKSESGVEGLSMELHAMTRVELTVSAGKITSDPIPDEDFAIPADWKIQKDNDFR